MTRPRFRRPAPRRLLLLAPLLLNLREIVAATRNRPHATQRRAAVTRLKELVPPPDRRALGGEDADDAAYARFLSVADWDPERAAPRVEKSFEWRKRVRPGSLRPGDCGALCRQGAWVAMLNGDGDDDNDDGDDNPRGPPPLDTPHRCPPLRSWRTTRHGLPVTYFRCWRWRPDAASGAEAERHVAYHVHHLIRRMRGDVERMCVVFDMRGFEAWMLPHIHQAVNVLRQHYPGRAGAMAFINVPTYFTAVWKVISPWLDDEIRSKVFFAPGGVDDADKAIAYLNGMDLKAGPA